MYVFLCGFFFSSWPVTFQGEHQPTYCKLSASFNLLYCGHIISAHSLRANAQSCDITSQLSWCCRKIQIKIFMPCSSGQEVVNVESPSAESLIQNVVDECWITRSRSKAGLSVVFGMISNSDSQLLRDGRRLPFGYLCSNNGDIWLQEWWNCTVILTIKQLSIEIILGILIEQRNTWK